VQTMFIIGASEPGSYFLYHVSLDIFKVADIMDPVYIAILHLRITFL